MKAGRMQITVAPDYRAIERLDVKFSDAPLAAHERY